MANDNLSMRGVTSAASSSSGIDVARLMGKNQSVGGGSADSQFQQVFDAQFNAASGAVSSGAKAASAVSDNSRRSGGNSSPQATQSRVSDTQSRDGRARDVQAQAHRNDRTQENRDDARRDAARQNDDDTRAGDGREAGRRDEDRTSRSERKNNHQDEREARNDTRHNAGTERKPAASNERDGTVKSKAVRNKNADQKSEQKDDKASADVAAQTAQSVATVQEKYRPAGAEPSDATEVAEDFTISQSLATAKVVDVANASSLTAATPVVSDEHSPLTDLLTKGEAKGTELPVSGEDGAGQSPSAQDLLRALQQLQSQANVGAASNAARNAANDAPDDAAAKLDAEGEAIVDPGLKDILTAMLEAKSQAGDTSALGAEGKLPDVSRAGGSEGMAPSDLLAAVARELAAARQRAQAGEKLPEASEDTTGMAVNDPSVGPKSAESPMANSNIPVTSLRIGSETMSPALLEKRGREANVADAQSNTGSSDNGATTSSPSGDAGASSKISDALTLLMPSHKSATQTDPANTQTTQPVAAPLTLEKTVPALDAAKVVTPPVQADQQMTAVREELRNLGKLVDNGLQAAGKITARETEKDEPVDVKPANLTRAIEDLATVAKPEVRNSATANNAVANNTPVVVGRPNFAEHMAEKILMMTTQKVQTAEIRLDPKELGAVDVKIHVHQDQASVVFSSPHAQVRDALESSIPRLREMFADAGVGLGSVNVNDRGASAGGGNEQSQGRNDGGNYGSGMDEVVEERTPRAPRESNGLVDFYA